MKITKQRKVVYTMVLIALFSALSFIGTFISIPFGPSKVHLGNFVCILAGLLCGPLVGGVSGALGMALNDVCHPAYGVDTIFRTAIVKFILGFTVGLIFRFIVKKEKKTLVPFIAIDSLFLVSFVTLLVLYIVKGPKFNVGEKVFKNSIFLIVSLGVLFVLFLIALIFSNKLKKINQYVLLVASIGGTLNVVLEFLIKIPFKVWFASMTYEQAFNYALYSLPSALLTMVLTIALVVAIYLPVYFATFKFNKLNDLYDNIVNLTTFKEEKENKDNNEVVNAQ